MPKFVTATATLVLLMPLIVNDSLGTKSPFLSYTVSAVPAATDVLINAVAPLLLPLIKVGVDSVIGSFR